MTTNDSGIRKYDRPAGGWDALGAVAKAIHGQMNAISGTRIMLRNNQPDGFDCPGCAWPDPKHTSAFEFCENGAKAVTWEATRKRATPEVFERHTVTELRAWSDHDIEDLGRLTHPMAYDAASDRYVAIGWDEANARIAAVLNALPDPGMAEFYTSGRASNEAAFLYQLFVRAYGTNNFPDCSNMCHEATSVGLPLSIGIGKGTVSLEDFDHADLIISMGHNPGTNHPRMMTTLHAASRRGAPIVVFNPLRERALERFAAPQDPIEMATFSATDIASDYLQVKVGGDAAALKGIMKAVLARDAEDLAAGGPGVLDRAFIAQHTDGFEALAEDLHATPWHDVERASGLDRSAIEDVALLYCKARSTIIVFGMGITQHRLGTDNVQQISNLLMLRGNYGRPGAGICPVRGHSNVQGNRTVGIDEKAPLALRQGIERVYGFVPPAERGHDAAEAIEAIADGRSSFLMCLGGNLAVAMADPHRTFAAMRGLELAVHIATKPNRSHLLVGRQSLLLPCLGRTELDLQTGGVQSITVEDSMSMVHASTGRLPPPSDQVRSEPAIVAGIAKAVLAGRHGIDWDAMVADYGRIRDAIEAVLPGFDDYNHRIKTPGGFRLPIGPTERIWHTASGRAQFIVMHGFREDPRAAGAGVLTLTTLRSHDQYNTTIYGFDDRYRGIFGRRDVVFLNADDMAAQGIAAGDRVDLEAVAFEGEATAPAAALRNLTAVAYDIPRGSAGAYYPEANVLVALSHRDPQSGTPSYKSVPVHLAAIGPLRRVGLMNALPSPISRHTVHVMGDDACQDTLAAEVPVSLVFNGIAHAVMMATPQDLEAFALGFALSEGILDHARDCFDIEVQALSACRAGLPDEVDATQVDLRISARSFERLKGRRRSMAGRNGCGVCGVESFAGLDLDLEPLATPDWIERVDASVVLRALDALPARQLLNAEAGAIHAAGWATLDGRLVEVMEDVGRHNALDKLIGTLAMRGQLARPGFVVLTSRGSHELVRKCARLGIAALCTVSAPTAMGVRMAQLAGVRLWGLCRAPRAVLYAAGSPHSGRASPRSSPSRPT